MSMRVKFLDTIIQLAEAELDQIEETWADEEMPLVLELPMHVISEVTYTEPGIKGDTATNTMKPATIATGAEVRVPLFIDTGEVIKVDTRTGEYVERVKD